MAITDMPSTITVTPMSPTIGAELSGVDLRLPQTDETLTAIRQALLDWKVVFFRDQDVTHEQHLDFGRRFGELEIHPFVEQHPEYPEVLKITHDAESHGFENVWHSDVTWRVAPSLGSILLMKEAPPLGGDTLFADMYAAYDGLSDAIKEEIDGAVARHDFSGFRRGMIRRGASDAEVQAFNELYPNPEHPVVRTHPETGRRGLYVNIAFTKEIIGMTPERSSEVLALLYDQAKFPEYQCRFRWQKHSIAFWDNRACQHYAVSDYWPNNRSVERVTVVGDVPYFDADQPVTGRAEQRPFRGNIDRARR